MIGRFFSHAADLPDYLSAHLLLTVLALLAGAAIGIPAGILVTRRERWRYPVLTAASLIQTIPALALLALMVPVLAALSGLTEAAFSFSVGSFGFAPVFVALALYGVLPILRNTVAGLGGVDPRVIEAAAGVGMTERQVLLKVRLPLAAPVILAGVRTAAVWTVGMATLATPVGQESLGNYIFKGLHLRNDGMVLFGCLAAAAVAVVLDMLLGGIERALGDRRRRLGLACGAGLALMIAAGLAAPALADLFRGPALAPVAAEEEDPDERDAFEGPVRIGSKTFSEQYILARLIRRRLEAAGLTTEETESLGSSFAFDALVAGEIDVYVDYTGTLWANVLGRTDTAPAWKVRDLVAGRLADEHGIRVTGSLGFENAYGLAMTRERARALGVRSIADLSGHAARLRAGGDIEVFDRPEWQSVLETYGLKFAKEVSYDPTFMYGALVDGEVDLITAFTTDGRIAVFDLVVLADPRRALPPYEAVILFSERAAASPRIFRALMPLIGGIPAEVMREANWRVDREEDPLSVDEAAKWLDARVGE